MSPSQPQQHEIKRNITVQPSSVSSTAWTPPVVSSAVSSSSYRTTHACPIDSISRTSKKEQITTKEDINDDCQLYKNEDAKKEDVGQKPKSQTSKLKEEVKQGISTLKSWLGKNNG